jgi:hypothetical protein
MARTGFGRKHTNGTATGTMDGKQVTTTARQAAATTPSVERKPSVDQLRLKAYEVYQARTRAGRPGDSTTDWLEAEKQLSSGQSHSARPHQ